MTTQAPTRPGAAEKRPFVREVKHVERPLVDPAVRDACKHFTPQQKADEFRHEIQWLSAPGRTMRLISPLSGDEHTIVNGKCDCTKHRCWHDLSWQMDWLPLVQERERRERAAAVQAATPVLTPAWTTDANGKRSDAACWD